MGSHEVVSSSDSKTSYGQLQIVSVQAVFIPAHHNIYSYIDAQSHQPVLWQFPAGCLLGQASLGFVKTTRAPMDVRQACE